MAELGIDISGHRSKNVDEFQGQQFDYVITVCDNVRRVNAKQRFREFQAARRTIQGYEAMGIIRKGKCDG